MIDFTTTAMCRPEIFVRTLNTFRDNLKGWCLSDSTLYLNVDPLPYGRPPDAVEKVAQHFFDRVVVNYPQKASFPAAVKWCWTQPTTDFFFHLEDDWELKVPFEMERLVRNLVAYPDVSCITLRAYKFPQSDQRICLSPGLFRTADARVMAERMSLTANPERQLRPVAPDNPEGGKHEGFVGMQTIGPPVVRDIGREWLAFSGWRKTRPVIFTTWEPRT